MRRFAENRFFMPAGPTEWQKLRRMVKNTRPRVFGVAQRRPVVSGKSPGRLCGKAGVRAGGSLFFLAVSKALRLLFVRSLKIGKTQIPEGNFRFLFRTE